MCSKTVEQVVPQSNKHIHIHASYVHKPQYAEHTLKTTKATQVLMSRSGSALNLSQWDYELTSGVDVYAEEVASNAGLHQVYFIGLIMRCVACKCANAFSLLCIVLCG